MNAKRRRREEGERRRTKTPQSVSFSLLLTPFSRRLRRILQEVAESAEEIALRNSLSALCVLL
jgi:hypothetical protein